MTKCILESVRVYDLVCKTKNPQDLSGKVSSIPFVTSNSTSKLASAYGFTKHKPCYLLQKKCQEDEELLAQTLNKDIQARTTQGPFGFLNGLADTSVQLPKATDIQNKDPVAEKLGDSIQLNEERRSDDSKDDVPSMELKTGVKEEQGAFKMKRRASETEGLPVAKKSKTHTHGMKLYTAKQSKWLPTDPNGEIRPKKSKTGTEESNSGRYILCKRCHKPKRRQI